MARETLAMTTFNDARYMNSNLDFKARTSIPVSNECMTKSDIENYLYAHITGTYSSNQLVPYNRIGRGLYVSITSKSIGYSSGSFTFVVDFDSDFNITDNASWITCSPSSGTGQTTITATYALNPNTSSRPATITINAYTIGQTATISVTQNANPGVAVDPISLAVGSGTSNACSNYASNNRSTYYIEDGKTFLSTNKLYTNSSGTTLAPSGIYTNGSNVRQWNGSIFTGFLDFC